MEGWFRPTGKAEWHYFRSGRSMCYGHTIREDAPKMESELGQWAQWQPNCKECERIRKGEVNATSQV